MTTADDGRVQRADSNRAGHAVESDTRRTARRKRIRAAIRRLRQARRAVHLQRAASNI